MTPLLATVVYAAGILMLFVLGSEGKSRTSKALLLPIVWLLINGSRPISTWFETQTVAFSNTAESSALYAAIEEGSPVDRNIYLVILAAALFVLFKRRTTVGRFLRANPVLLWFVAYCGISIAWSDFPFIAFKRWIRLLGDLAMVLIVLTESDRKSALKKALSSTAFVLFPLSVLLIKYYPQLARYYSPWDGRQFFSGVSVDKNMLGMTCLVFGLGVMWQFLCVYLDKKKAKRTRQMIAYAAMLGTVLWLFHVIDSMTSLSCFILGSSLLLLTSLFRTARKPVIVSLLVATAVGISFSVLFLHVNTGALTMMGRNATLTGRTDIWEGVLAFRGNPIVGTGFDSFWLGDRLRRIWASGGQLFGINEAHNGYLEAFLNLGWIGVVLLTMLIVTGYRNILAALRREPDIAALRLAFFTAVVVYSFTEAGFRTNCPVWIAFLLAIVAVPKARPSKGTRTLDTSNSATSKAEVELRVASSLAS